MESAGLRWYRLGHVNVTQGSTTVTGIGTNWVYAGIKTGDALLIEGWPLVEISSVENDTKLILATAFPGMDAQGKDYAIIRNWAETMQAEMASKLAVLLGRYEFVINEELKQIQGLSAYELAVQKGYTGTLDEWLESLKGGPRGAAGADGKDAYAIAVEEGFRGTRKEWLESLKAPSPYNLAVQAGFTGTLQDWLDDLRGLSAYELAVQKGFNGTLEEWLASLKPEDGKSAYEIAVANGFKGTQQDWLIFLARECALYCPYKPHVHFSNPHFPPEGPFCPIPQHVHSDRGSGDSGIVIDGGTDDVDEDSGLIVDGGTDDED